MASIEWHKQKDTINGIMSSIVNDAVMNNNIPVIEAFIHEFGLTKFVEMFQRLLLSCNSKNEDELKRFIESYDCNAIIDIFLDNSNLRSISEMFDLGYKLTDKDIICKFITKCIKTEYVSILEYGCRKSNIRPINYGEFIPDSMIRNLLKQESWDILYFIFKHCASAITPVAIEVHLAAYNARQYRLVRLIERNQMNSNITTEGIYENFV